MTPQRWVFFYDMANPIGRPSKYTPEVINEINKYLVKAVPENMQIPTIEGIALKLDISRDTLYEWAKVHPDFSYTLDRLKMIQKEALIQTGIFGGKEINQAIVALLLKVNHDMIETSRQELVGKDGQPIQFSFKIDLAGGYIPPLGATFTSSSTGFTGSTQVQDTRMAQTGEKDDNGINGDNKTGSL